MTTEEKKKEVERLLLELLEESRGSIDVQIGNGYIVMSKHDNWYTSSGECCPRHSEILGNKCQCDVCVDANDSGDWMP